MTGPQTENPSRTAVWIGPIAPAPGRPTLYALDAEESSMAEPEEEFSSRTVRIDHEYTRVNTTYALSVLPSTDSGDVFILDSAYQSQPELVGWLRELYRSIGVEFASRVYFADPKNFAKLAEKLAQEDAELSTISTICYSYNLCRTFDVQRKNEISRYLNAKTSLVELAERYSFDIPRTAVATVGAAREVSSSQLGFPTVPVYVKMNGLGGGYNVVRIAEEQEFDTLLDGYDPDQGCTVQQAVDSSYFETIHLYTSADSGAEYQGSRIKITADGQWYGNIFLPELTLTDRQRHTADAAAHAAWQEGYRSEQPLLIGFDGFMNSHELLITEINARWLGSSPAEHIMKRLGIYGKVTAMSAFDYIAGGEFDLYTHWVERNSYAPSGDLEKKFTLLPMGTSGYPEENGSRLVNLIIFGDVHACEKDARTCFSDDSFTLLRNSVSTFDNVLAKGCVG